MMNKPGKTGIPRLVAATGYSLKGLGAAWQSEEAFRLEASLSAVLIPLAFWVTDNLVHQLLLVLCSVLVIITELINSAIEAAIDRIGDEIHPLSGQAKDIGSAAVMISLLMLAVAWGSSIWRFFSL